MWAQVSFVLSYITRLTDKFYLKSKTRETSMMFSPNLIRLGLLSSEAFSWLYRALYYIQ